MGAQQKKKKKSELNISAGLSIMNKESPEQGGPRDLSDMQCTQRENTGGKESCLSLGGTSMTIKVLMQGKPVGHTKLYIYESLQARESITLTESQ